MFPVDIDRKKPYVYFMHVNMLIELRIPFLVSFIVRRFDFWS